MLKLRLFCLKNEMTSISRDEALKSQQKQIYNSKVAPYLSLIAGVKNRHTAAKNFYDDQLVKSIFNDTYTINRKTFEKRERSFEAQSYTKGKTHLWFL